MRHNPCNITFARIVDAVAGPALRSRSASFAPAPTPLPLRTKARGEAPHLVAPVQGFSAWALGRLIEEHGAEQVAALRRLVERGRLDSAWLDELQRTCAAVMEAASQWLEWEQHRGMTADSDQQSRQNCPPAQASLDPLSCPEVDTRVAAHLLGVTTSRIRQLLRSGEFAGRKIGRIWLVSSASVAAYQDVRSAGNSPM